MHKATALARLSSTTSVSSSFGGSSLDTAVRASIRATFDRLSSALLHRGHGATHRAPNGHAHGHGPRTGSTTASVTATLHACQVLISADAAAPETDRTLQLPQLVMDELEETVPRVLAMHGDDALRVAASLRNSSSSGHGDDTGSSTFLSSPHALNAFGAIVDRLLVATTREQQQRGPLAPVAGVHTTLYYTLDDMNGKPAPVVLPFHLPSSSAATRRFKSVGRWPGEFRSNNDESATTTSTTASADNNWFGKFLAKQNATHTAVAGGTSSAQQHAARAPSLRDPTPSIFRDPTLTPGDITRFILLADNEPYDALRTLDRVFPRARKTGVVGAWTPFVNGRAHTLWLNDEVMMGGGVVGLGYQEEKGGGGNIDENDRVHHLGVREIGRPFQITK